MDVEPNCSHVLVTHDALFGGRARRAAGMIWPPPLWMASVCKVTSWMLNLTALMFSSHMTPSLVAHWKPATTESLISFKYWTPLVTSISRLGPLVSGPKHQIFLASPTS